MKARIVKPSSTSTTSTPTKAEQQSQREVIAEKLRAKQINDEANLTFKPKLLSSRHSMGTSVSESTTNRFERLYSDASKRLLKSNNASTTAASTTSADDGRSTSATRLSISKAQLDESVNRMYKSSGAGSRSSSATRRVASSCGTGSVYDSSSSGGKEKEPSFQPKITKRASSIDRSLYTREENSTRLHEKYKHIQKKHEKLKAEIEKERAAACTFSPEMITKHYTSTVVAAGAANHTMDLPTRMHNFEELKKKKRDERIKMQMDAELNKATFKPSINTYSKDVAASVASTATDNVFTRLNSRHQTPTPVIREADETFHPKISDVSKSIVSVRTSNSAVSIHDRLYTEAEKKRKEHEKLIDIHMKEEDALLTFKPTIHDSSSGVTISSSSPSVSSKPSSVFDRLTSSRQHVQNVLTQLKSDIELNDCSFQPHIPDSAVILSKLYVHDDVSIHERLNKEAEILKEKRKELKQKHDADASDYPFQPHIPDSAVILSKHVLADVPIHERLNKEAELLKEKRKELMQKRNASNDYSFQPHIPDSAGILSKHIHADVPIYERLNKEAELLKEKREKLMQTHEVSDCSFQPHIPDSAGILSKHIHADVPIYERLNKEAELLKEKREKLQLEELAKQLESFSFKPVIPHFNSNSSARNSLSSHDSIHTSIDNNDHEEY